MIHNDIQFIKGILPPHYSVAESKKSGSIHCKSNTGLRNEKGGDDDEHFGYFFNAVKGHFGDRFQEVFHNVCSYHSDFTIYLKN